MALGSNPYRKVFIDDMAKLQDLSVLAERAYIHLAFGQRSTACCLVRMKPDALRLELREHSRAKVTAALDELEAAGWLSIDRQTWTIALPVQAQRTPSENASVSQGKWKEAQKFPPSRQRDEVLDTIAQELARWEAQSEQRERDGVKTVPRTSNRSSISSSNSIPSVPKGTDTPAVANVTPWALPSEPQADEVDPFANQPDPWGNIQRTVPDEVDPNFRPQVKLTPLAQAKRDAADAARQQTLTLTPPKPSKTLTPGQLDAIFAKKRMAATVDLWNELLGKTTCGPCSHKEVAKMATQLMSNLAKYVSSDAGRDGSALIGWAKAKSEYHSGRAGRTWTLQQWLSAEHLSLVFADYRNERGDERKIRYLPERTLTDWRLAVEAQEAATQSEAA
jgi:hypothetical protein